MAVKKFQSVCSYFKSTHLETFVYGELDTGTIVMNWH